MILSRTLFASLAMAASSVTEAGKEDTGFMVFIAYMNAHHLSGSNSLA